MYLNPDVPLAYNVVQAPCGAKVTDCYIDPNDPWTVIVKVNDFAWPMWEDVGEKIWMYAPEVIKKYGDAKDWKNNLGTGPFMLTDYVPASSLTFVKNPRYWAKDPCGPGKGNQIPYVDGVKALTITDPSTRMTAIRTGKADWIWGISQEDIESLQQTSPWVNIRNVGVSLEAIGTRMTSTDPRAIPLMNQRVRQALTMAIDHETIIRDYFDGKAYMLPVAWFPGEKYYTPIEDMPPILEKILVEKEGYTPEAAKKEGEILLKMYTYHPEEAKKLLAEAGYPNGCKTTMMLLQEKVDYYSIATGYWKTNLNVDVEMDVRDSAVFRSIISGHTHPAMMAGMACSLRNSSWMAKWPYLGPADPKLPRNVTNHNELSYPFLSDTIYRSDECFRRYDFDGISQIVHEFIPYHLWTGWYTYLPAGFNYCAWQPWLRNNYGVSGTGHKENYGWVKYCWLDLDLKEKLTGTR